MTVWKQTPWMDPANQKRLYTLNKAEEEKRISVRTPLLPQGVYETAIFFCEMPNKELLIVSVYSKVTCYGS